MKKMEKRHDIEKQRFKEQIILLLKQSNVQDPSIYANDFLKNAELTVQNNDLKEVIETMKVCIYLKFIPPF